MASGPRSTARPGGAPGRSPSRSRSAHGRSGSGRPSARPTDRPGGPRPDRPGPGAAPAGHRQRGGVSITGRAIALAVVLLLLTISYASSLRIYFAQEHDIAATRATIADREVRIAELETALTRWDDADYVRTQARARLGWVVPGEIGFRVVDAEGKPLGGGAQIEGGQQPAPATQAAWWSQVWGGVAAADRPAPAKAQPAKKPTVTVDTKPSR